LLFTFGTQGSQVVRLFVLIGTGSQVNTRFNIRNVPGFLAGRRRRTVQMVGMMVTVGLL
jgi:hypothetical protein